MIHPGSRTSRPSLTLCGTSIDSSTLLTSGSLGRALYDLMLSRSHLLIDSTSLPVDLSQKGVYLGWRGTRVLAEILQATSTGGTFLKGSWSASLTHSSSSGRKASSPSSRRAALTSSTHHSSQ